VVDQIGAVGDMTLTIGGLLGAALVVALGTWMNRLHKPADADQ
jgi:hypothetical protein